MTGRHREPRIRLLLLVGSPPRGVRELVHELDHPIRPDLWNREHAASVTPQLSTFRYTRCVLW